MGTKNSNNNVNNNVGKDEELSVAIEKLKSSDGKAFDDPDYKLDETRISTSSFLLKYPRGAYTSARTVKRNSIMDLQSHIDRTVHSLKLMKFIPEKKNSTEKNLDNDDDNDREESSQVKQELAPYRDPNTFKRMVIPLLRVGLSRYCNIEEESSQRNKEKESPQPNKEKESSQNNKEKESPQNNKEKESPQPNKEKESLQHNKNKESPQHNNEIKSPRHNNEIKSPRHNKERESHHIKEKRGEVKITILVCYSFEEKRPILVVHFTALHVPNSQKCRVEVYGEPRKAAEAKDSQWVRDREALESSMNPGFNEILLSDSHTQNIYEGLSSNFFVVLHNPDTREPLVVTAPLQYVVEGTILKIVKMICERDKIDLQFWFPNTNDTDRWEGAFITSTSRLVLPIDIIKFRDGRPIVKLPTDNKTIEHIKKEVEKEIYNRAYRILWYRNSYKVYLSSKA